jgi:DNA-binding transcriptional MerR regulator
MQRHFLDFHLSFGLHFAIKPTGKVKELSKDASGSLRLTPYHRRIPMDTSTKTANEPGYAIGDVAKICGVPAHTIRFWEKELCEFISPVRTRGKQRRYSDGQIRRIMSIKKLLWTDRYSIQGAKRILRASEAVTFAQPQENLLVKDPQQFALSIARFIHEQLTRPQTVLTGLSSKTVA